MVVCGAFFIPLPLAARFSEQSIDKVPSLYAGGGSYTGQDSLLGKRVALEVSSIK